MCTEIAKQNKTILGEFDKIWQCNSIYKLYYKSNEIKLQSQMKALVKLSLFCIRWLGIIFTQGYEL